MVIFHSYVSLPEGNRLPTATKPIQALFFGKDWQWVTNWNPLRVWFSKIFSDFFPSFPGLLPRQYWYPTVAYARPQRGPRGRLGGLLNVHWHCLWLSLVQNHYWNLTLAWISGGARCACCDVPARLFFDCKRFSKHIMMYIILCNMYK